MLLPRLSSMFPEIQKLPVKQGSSEDMTEVLWLLIFSRYGQGGIWDTNTCPLHTPGGAILEGTSNLLPNESYE